MMLGIKVFSSLLLAFAVAPVALALPMDDSLIPRDVQALGESIVAEAKVVARVASEASQFINKRIAAVEVELVQRGRKTLLHVSDTTAPDKELADLKAIEAAQSTSGDDIVLPGATAVGSEANETPADRKSGAGNVKAGTTTSAKMEKRYGYNGYDGACLNDWVICNYLMAMNHGHNEQSKAPAKKPARKVPASKQTWTHQQRVDFWNRYHKNHKAA